MSLDYFREFVLVQKEVPRDVLDFRKLIKYQT